MKKTIAITGILGMAVLAAPAGIITSENFDSATVGNTATDLGAPWTGGGRIQYTVQDSHPMMGAGGNQYFQLNAGASAWTFVNNTGGAGNGVVTHSFDFHYDSTLMTDGYLRLGGVGNGGNLFFIDIGLNNDLTFGEEILSGNTYHIDVVANISGSSANYAGSDIATGTYDLWLDGVNIRNDVAVLAAGAGSSSFTQLGVWMNGGGTAGDKMLIDNYVTRDDAYAIPEPGTLGLIAAFGGGLLFIRRRLKI